MSDHPHIDTFTLAGAAARFQRALAFEDPEVAFHIEVNGRTLETLLAIRTGDNPQDFERLVLKPGTLLGLADALQKAADYVRAKQAERGTK